MLHKAPVELRCLIYIVARFNSWVEYRRNSLMKKQFICTVKGKPCECDKKGCTSKQEKKGLKK